MKTSVLSSRRLVRVCGLFAGVGALCVVSVFARHVTPAGALGVSDSAPMKRAFAQTVPYLGFCHSAMPATPIGMATHLAASRTEVPPAEIQASTPNADFADSDPPLWEGLGSVSYNITTASPAAQAYFDQGLRLTYAFNHGEAQRAFRKAQRLDPRCAMCFWGEALVLGPNINLPMAPEAAGPAFAAVRKAAMLAGGASEREQTLIAALATRYAEDPTADRKALDAAYAAAMAKAAERFPADDEIAVLYAEAVMDLSPWDYWQPGGHEANPQSAPVVPTLERVLARNPNHPGAMHYYIHAVEASDRPRRAEAAADRLSGAIPAAGHLVHMPSHIYYRVGRYLDAFAVNKAAVEVDEKYLDATGAPMGVYRLGYYPHNIHFMIASAQMAGDGPVVIAAAEKLRGLIPEQIARGIALTHPIVAAPYFAHAQFSAPDTILALPDPGPVIPYVQGMWHYARGVAYAQKGEAGAATAEANAIAELERTADFSMLKDVGVPAQEVLKLARAMVVGRLAQAQAKYDVAIASFEEAAALQDALPYTEPPYWYYPVRQTLAAALLQAGRLDEAETQFRRALERAPSNGWSYYGLVQLYKAKGDQDSANQTEAKLAQTWIGDRALLQLSKL
jgi:tetratricopeptide (TPR) repeat protein